MKTTVISWEDERWSASKEDLKNINKMISKNETKKRSLLSKADPQSILLFFMYILGFIYHGGVSIFKWLIKKLKRNEKTVLITFACFLFSGCYSPDTVYVREYYEPRPRFGTSFYIHHDYHHDYHHDHHRHSSRSRKSNRSVSKVITPSRNPAPPPSRPISKGVPDPPSNPLNRK